MFSKDWRVNEAIVRGLLKATYKNKDEKDINGVYVDIENNKLVATDQHQMAILTLKENTLEDIEDGGDGFILRRDVIQKKFISRLAHLNLAYCNKRDSSTDRFINREYGYPNYKRIVPTEETHKAIEIKHQDCLGTDDSLFSLVAIIAKNVDGILLRHKDLLNFISLATSLKASDLTLATNTESDCIVLEADLSDSKNGFVEKIEYIMMPYIK